MKEFVVMGNSKAIDVSILGPHAKVSDFIYLHESSDGGFKTEKDGSTALKAARNQYRRSRQLSGRDQEKHEQLTSARFSN
jgi:hypothetical protein